MPTVVCSMEVCPAPKRFTCSAGIEQPGCEQPQGAAQRDFQPSPSSGSSTSTRARLANLRATLAANSNTSHCTATARRGPKPNTAINRAPGGRPWPPRSQSWRLGTAGRGGSRRWWEVEKGDGQNPLLSWGAAARARCRQEVAWAAATMM